VWRWRTLAEHGDPYVFRVPYARFDELSSRVVTRQVQVLELAGSLEESAIHAPGVLQWQ